MLLVIGRGRGVERRARAGDLVYEIEGTGMRRESRLRGAAAQEESKGQDMCTGARLRRGAF